MDLNEFIDVTDVDLKKLVSVAFDLSRPQGMGFLHHREGPLSDEDIDNILNHERGATRLSMDYVHGRSCKFHVRMHEGRLYIRKNWYDHHEDDVRELCKRMEIQYA